jgi:hypothetical protein
VAARFVEAGWEVFYWRDREADLIVRGPQGENLTIEVKSAAASSADLHGLRIFWAREPQFEPCLISMVDQLLPGTRTLAAETVLSLSRGHSQLL